MEINQLDSKTIAWLRFPLAIAVVFIHNFGQPSEINLSELHTLPITGMDVYNYVRICFSHVITHVAVPVFYIFSGYSYKKNGGGNYLSRIKKKTKTLLVPYVLWNLIALLCILAFKLGGVVINGNPIDGIWRFLEENGWWHLFWDCNQWGFGKENWFGCAQPINTGPVNFPLWFLRDLFVVVLLTPIIEWFLKHFHYYGVILLAFCYASHTWFDIHGLSISAIFFFSAGAYLSLNNKSLVMELFRIKIPCYVISAILFVMMIWYDGSNTRIGNCFYSLYVISMVGSIVNLSSLLVRRKWVNVNKWLSNSSFFIYVFHTILIVTKSVGFICEHIFDSMNPFVMVIKYFVVTVLTVLVSLLAYWIMQKCLPKFLNVFMGSR